LTDQLSVWLLSERQRGSHIVWMTALDLARKSMSPDPENSARSSIASIGSAH
jgi:hypothetical protein